jgi:ubiquinone/menaquinone biosynthesis C-methylase UbiE
MKKNFDELEFTDENTIDYWENLYDQKDFNAYCYKQRKAIVLSWLDGLGLSKNPIILDAGCGPGRFVWKADKMGYKVIGLDYSHGMLVKASSIRKNAAFLQGDIQSMPFKPSSFDVIVCLGVIAYLQSEEKALSELARVFNTRGVSVISFINKARLVKKMDLPLLFKGVFQKNINSNILFWNKGTISENNFSLN